MKRLLKILPVLLIVMIAAFQYDAAVTSSTTGSNIHQVTGAAYDDLTLFSKPSQINQFARQVEVPAGPVEERKPINWWWWIIGVILVIGAGMLLYVWMKKDPKKDA